MMGKIMVCYGCTKRTAHCHAECEEYRKQAAERQKLRDKKYAETKAAMDYNAVAKKRW